MSDEVFNAAGFGIWVFYKFYCNRKCVVNYFHSDMSFGDNWFVGSRYSQPRNYLFDNDCTKVAKCNSIWNYKNAKPL